MTVEELINALDAMPHDVECECNGFKIISVALVSTRYYSSERGDFYEPRVVLVAEDEQ